MRIGNAVRAYPHFVKIAPLLREMRRYPAIEALLLHASQRYDEDRFRLCRNALA